MNGKARKTYEFGPFYLDGGGRTLFCNDRPVNLTTKVFDILWLLVLNRGEVVERERFMKEVWLNSFVEESNLTVSISTLRKVLREGQSNIRYIETVAGRGYRFVAKVRQVRDRTDPNHARTHVATPAASGPADHNPAINSLAVLPMANASGDPDLEYLVDGITERIIDLLSRLPTLRVMARNTVFRYQGQEIDTQKVGRELNVRAILLGRVIQIEERLIIRTELIDVRDGTQIWGEQYNHLFSDTLAVQEEIATAISGELKLKLSSEEKRLLIKRQTESLEAYHLYLKGRYFWTKYTAKWVKKGIEHFQQAIEIDPHYALAYSGLADAYFRLSSSHLPPREALPKAKAAARKAVEIDDSLAEAHTSLGMARVWCDYDWTAANQEFQRAIELNPVASIAHQRYGEYLMFMERFDEALTELRIAETLDPLSLWINVSLGTILNVMRHYDEAIEQLEKALDMDPNYYPVRFCLGMVYLGQHRYEKALAEFQQVLQIEGDSSLVLGFIGHTHALSGEREKAEKVLHDLIELSKVGYVSPYALALIHTGLGDRKQAFVWLEELYNDHNEWNVWLRVAPEFDELRSDARFINLLSRIGSGRKPASAAKSSIVSRQ